MLSFISAGESHGEGIVAILEGMVAGLKVDASYINEDLKRRQGGYGRSVRMKMEKDTAHILAGMHHKVTTGSPIALMVKNNVRTIEKLPAITSPRPGHADLAGMLKYGIKDARTILERSSARETVARVAVGSICKKFLEDFGVFGFFHVVNIGGVEANTGDLSLKELEKKSSRSALWCADQEAEKCMREKIDTAAARGDTLGGVGELVMTNVVAGVGTFTSWRKRLDARIAEALMSIPSVKGVEIGIGFRGAHLAGSLFHDPVYYSKKEGFHRSSNNAGGIEGGMSNGEVITVRLMAKPIPTLTQGLDSVNVVTKETTQAHNERHDTVVLGACGVIAQAMLSFVLADAYLEKFGGDSLHETKMNFLHYCESIQRF